MLKRHRTSGSKGSAARRLAVLLIALACAAGSGLVLAGAFAAPAQVSAYPIPGSRVAPPGAQIAFRGVSADQLRNLRVVGSSTGAHSGTVRVHTDSRGVSFLPENAFQPGETVTVSSGVNVRGASRGSFQFTVARPAPEIQPAPLPPAPRKSGDVQQFHTAPELRPAAVNVTNHGSSPPGNILVAPQQGPVQNGPMILDQDGQLVWFRPLPDKIEAADFRVQHYESKPVLTWWQGYVGAGVGVGEGVILDRSYSQIATVRAANGLHADLHEFTLTPRGTALITAYYPVWSDGSSVGAAKHQVVLDSVVQEIDVKTGLLLFQWDSLDHVPLSDSYTEPPKQAGSPLDHFHVNSVEEDRDGNLLISARNTSSAYKVNRETGRILWTLGGKHSSFKMGAGTSFAFQHDVRLRTKADRVTLFDNGGGPPRISPTSRGLTLKLDVKRMTATRLAEQPQPSPAPANYEGNLQPLPNGGAFLGWGQQPYFTELDSRGRVVLEGRFVPATAHYRAYLLPWSGTPAATRPAVSTSTAGDETTVYASWNGASRVSSWRLLAGETPDRLSAIASSARQGFETSIHAPYHRYVAVQALDADGHVLASSTPTKAAEASG